MEGLVAKLAMQHLTDSVLKKIDHHVTLMCGSMLNILVPDFQVGF